MLKIKISNCDDEGVLVTTEDKEGAEDDQSIDGCRWECPDDLHEAYAILSDRPSLLGDLEADGYDVDSSEYAYYVPDECASA